MARRWDGDRIELVARSCYLPSGVVGHALRWRVAFRPGGAVRGVQVRFTGWTFDAESALGQLLDLLDSYPRVRVFVNAADVPAAFLLLGRLDRALWV